MLIETMTNVYNMFEFKSGEDNESQKQCQSKYYNQNEISNNFTVNIY